MDKPPFTMSTDACHLQATVKEEKCEVSSVKQDSNQEIPYDVKDEVKHSPVIYITTIKDEIYDTILTSSPLETIDTLQGGDIPVVKEETHMDDEQKYQHHQ